MLIPLAIGTVMMVVNLGVQVFTVTILIRYFMNYFGNGGLAPSMSNDVRILSVMMAVLFAGHILQFATWALLFTWLGEFTDFATAFYHSTVNFTSLGYGDIVMSEKWRLLGALEAANGVLMFGLTAGAILSIMNVLFRRRKAVAELKENLGMPD